MGHYICSTFFIFSFSFIYLGLFAFALNPAHGRPKPGLGGGPYQDCISGVGSASLMLPLSLSWMLAGSLECYLRQFLHLRLPPPPEHFMSASGFLQPSFPFDSRSFFILFALLSSHGPPIGSTNFPDQHLPAICFQALVLLHPWSHFRFTCVAFPHCLFILLLSSSLAFLAIDILLTIFPCSAWCLGIHVGHNICRFSAFLLHGIQFI